MKVRRSCRSCSEVYDGATSGTVKGIGVVAAAALGVRLHPLAGLGLALVSILWGDKIEAAIQSKCPSCNLALKVIGTIYG